MLGREHDLGDPHRLAIPVLHRDLALGIGTELAGGPVIGLARLGQRRENLVRVIDRGGQQFGGFTGRIAEHNALIAGADILVAGLIDADGDVGGLAMKQHIDAAGLPVEAGLLVADGTDSLACGGLELGRIDHRGAGGVGQDGAILAFFQQRLGNPDFTGDDHAIGGGQGFAGDADLGGVHIGLLGLLEHQIDDFVGDAVANLVRMPLGNGFRGKKIVRTGHVKPLCKVARAHAGVRVAGHDPGHFQPCYAQV